MDATTERVKFPGAFGDRLAAALERPPGDPSAYALFAHCFTCSKDLKAVRRISRALAEQGIAVLRFDFTGIGESGGDFADTDFSSNLEDLVAAADFLRERYRAPSLLVGHSIGGSAVLAAAHRVPEAEVVATIAAPSDPAHLAGKLREKVPELGSRDEAEVELGGRSFRIRRALLEDLEEQSLRGKIENLGLPLLLFHSPADETVGIEHAWRIFEAAAHPKSLISLDGADHLLLADQRDARFVGSVLAAWAARYLEAGETQAVGRGGESPGDAADGVRVAGGASGYRQEIAAGHHRLWADEPEEVGGADTGPDPYALVLAGLGACKSMTMRMYADRKEWPLEGTEVRLRHSKIHAEDCADCETKEGKIDRIEVELELAGPLSEDQRRRLLEIADRCPVHRTLTSEISIKSRLRS